MFHYSSSSLLSLFYLAVANVVVARTLQLRAKRGSAGAAAVGKEPEDDIAPAAATPVASQALAAEPAATSSASVASTNADTALTQVKASSSGKPPAGNTFRFSEGVSPNVPINTWSRCDHRKFKLRVGPNYDRNKQKAPSAVPLYEVFAVDVFCTDKRIDNVTSRMELPDCSDLNIANPNVPAIFVVQVQMPSDPPPMLSTVEDGPGWALVLYFKMTKETCDQLANMETASAAVKLFAKWCENCEDPSWKSRFKVITYVVL